MKGRNTAARVAELNYRHGLGYFQLKPLLLLKKQGAVVSIRRFYYKEKIGKESGTFEQ